VKKPCFLFWAPQTPIRENDQRTDGGGRPDRLDPTRVEGLPRYPFSRPSGKRGIASDQVNDPSLSELHHGRPNAAVPELLVVVSARRQVLENPSKGGPSLFYAERSADNRAFQFQPPSAPEYRSLHRHRRKVPDPDNLVTPRGCNLLRSRYTRYERYQVEVIG
jgi:hypothetical protein